MEKIEMLVCLIGEQPVPNLLPIRQYKPNKILLIHSERTRRISKNLERMLLKQDVQLLKIDNPFDIVESVGEMAYFLSTRVPAETKLTFNITGGTKAMSQAAYIIAQKLKAPILYLQSEGFESKLYVYRFDNSLAGLSSPTLDGLSSPTTEPLTKFLSIDDYLQVHGLSKPKYQKPKNPFEEQVSFVLQANFSEIRRNIKITASLEIDLMIRCENNYGIAELKTGAESRKKSPIDQIVGATSREFLGTYTKRLLILDQNLARENAELAKAYNVRTIVLNGYEAKTKKWSSGAMPTSEKTKLIQTVTQILGSPKSKIEVIS